MSPRQLYIEFTGGNANDDWTVSVWLSIVDSQIKSVYGVTISVLDS